MKLEFVPASHIDVAWRDGACALKASCDTSGGEITVDQLKYMLSRGERTLIRGTDGDVVSWAVIGIDQLPNIRALHVYQLVGSGFDRFFAALSDYARAQGCSEVRCSAKEAQARLYRIKLGFEPVYTTLRVRLT